MCQCRICLDEVPEDERHQFCNCIGSNGYVHFECLEKWIRGNNYKDKCEICNSKYKIKFVPKYAGLLGIDFMIILILFIASFVGCIYVWLSFYSSNINLTKYIKNTTAYLPLILSHGLRFKHLNSKKILSYKLVFNGNDEDTPLIENGSNHENINNDDISINLSSDLEEDAQPLVVD